MFNNWFFLVLCSALALGGYDLCKKHAVNQNSVLPVLFLSTLCGSSFFSVLMLAQGQFLPCIACGWKTAGLILIKSFIVSGSWLAGYYALRTLPISIAAPIRATSPVWTFIGGLCLYHEIPTWAQGGAMALIFAGYFCFSLVGHKEGLTFSRSHNMQLAILGTLLGAASALYDKFLLNSLSIPHNTVQLHFCLDLIVIFAVVWTTRCLFFQAPHFEWRWSIPCTGVLLILADALYFTALGLPDVQISQVALIRRTSCIVTFVAGAIWFHDKNVRAKALILVLILAGVTLLALA